MNGAKKQKKFGSEKKVANRALPIFKPLISIPLAFVLGWSNDIQGLCNTKSSSAFTDAMFDGSTILFGEGDTHKSLTIDSSSGSYFTDISFIGGRDSTNNELIIQVDAEIEQQTIISSGQDLRLDLNANLTNEFSNGGYLYLDFNTAGASIVGSIANSGRMALTFNSSGRVDGEIISSDATYFYIENGATAVFDGALKTQGSGTIIANFQGGNAEKSLVLNESGNTISTVYFAGLSTQNSLILNNGNTTITSGVYVDTNQAFSIVLNNQSSVMLNRALTTNSGGNTSVNFGEGSNPKSLILNASANTITSVALGANSTSNTLALGNGSTTISDNVKVKEGQELSFNLADGTTLNFANGLTTSSLGVSNFNLGFSGDLSTTTSLGGALINGGTNVFNINPTAMSLMYGTDGLSFAGGANIINFENTSGSTLNWQNGNGDIKDIATSGGETQINFTNNGVIGGGVSTSAGKTTIAISDGKNGTINGILSTSGDGVTDVDFGAGGNVKNLTLNEGGNTITSITLGASSTQNSLILNNGETTIVGGVNVGVSQGLVFNLNNASSLVFNGALITEEGGAMDIVFGNSNGSKSLTLNEGGNTIRYFIIRDGSSSSNTLTLNKGATRILSKIGVDATQNFTLNLNNESSATIEGSFGRSGGGDTNVNFGDNGGAKALILSLGGNITSIALGTNSTSNSLVFNNGNTTITNGVNVGASQALAFNLNNASSLVFNGALTTDAGGATNVSFGDDNGKKTLTLNEGGNTITSITLVNDESTLANFLVFNKGETIISNDINVGVGQGLEFDLNGGSSVVLNGALIKEYGSGNTSINFGGGNLTKSLTFNENGNTVTEIIISPNSTSNSLFFTKGSTTIEYPRIEASQELSFNLENESNVVIEGDLTTDANGITNVNFGNNGGVKILTLNGANSTITSIALGTNSVSNFLALNNIETTIINEVSVGASQALAFNISDGTTLNFTNGLTTDVLGTSTFNLGSDNVSSTTTTISGTLSNSGTNVFNVNSETTALKYDTNGLAFAGGTNIINFENTSGSTLNWQNSSGELKDIVTSGGETQINFTNNGTIGGGVSTSGGESTIAIANGKTAVVLGNINTSGGKTNIDFKGNGTLSSSINTSNTGNTEIRFVGDNTYAVIGGNVTTSGVVDQTSSPIKLAQSRDLAQATTSISFSGNGGALILKGNDNTISSVSFGNGNYILSLAEPTSRNGEEAREERRSLVIDTLNTSSGTLTLGTQINAQEADTFVINNVAGDKQGKYHFGIVVEDGTQLEDIVKVKLASVVNNDADIEFESKSNFIVGFAEAQAEIQKVDEGAYTSYYILKAQGGDVSLAEQAVTATAFTFNYDLYMANLNSLNRRMGELRENAHSQGVWVRVFNGGLSNDFGLGSKTNYTTIQAGYDYAFGFEGANNYLGVALSYALSLSSVNSKAEDAMAGVRSLDNIYSNAVEVALYNSYVSDSGWYNDSIAKFSYIMSSFDIQANGSNIQDRTISSDTTNYAFTLSDEVGYAFRLGELSEWSITPQAELTFGYFNQSDFKQTLQEHYLDSKADSILTLRARVGSAFAYDFRAFTQESGFNASLYAGVFYEYDYVSGGDISMTTDVGVHSNHFSNLESDNRVVMNVGTNMTIQDNTRLYFDFEKSFVGKINTDYQVNLGVRYSFGENGGYVSTIEKAGYKAPLKVENSNEAEGEEEGGAEE